MAGRPKKQAMMAELERLTREEFGEETATHLDYAELWVASGNTILSLADRLSTALGVTVHREALSKYLNGLERAQTQEGTLTRARARGGHAIAEGTLALADSATEDNVQSTRLQVQTRQWLSERWNPAELGAKQAGGVTITIGTLMLDALRQPIEALGVTAIPSAIAAEADVLSIEETSTSDTEQRTTHPSAAARLEPATQLSADAAST